MRTIGRTNPFAAKLQSKVTLMPTKPKPATAPTVTLKHMAAKLAETHELTKKGSEAFLNDMVGLIVRSLKKGERLRFSGLGILQVRKRAARMGRNPATGETI
jgi:DNA-binding protein HU-beta